MNKTLKVFLIILAVLVALCACSGVALVTTGVLSLGNLANSIEAGSTEDPLEVDRIASTIAEFDIPDGFDRPFGLNAVGFKAVGYYSDATDTRILILQLPGKVNLDIQDVLRMMNENSANGDLTINGGELENVEKRPITIHGQQTTLSIDDGLSAEGESVRIGSVSFSGQQGNQTILVISSPKNNWNEDMVHSFIGSIK